MSPRAACRLENLGFTDVYDYVGGIADWKASGRPVEGTGHDRQRVSDATRTDVPTCSPSDTVADAVARTDATPWEICVVLGCDRIVVGKLRIGEVGPSSQGPVEDSMDSGPATVRPDELLQPLVERMGRRGTSDVLVTTPEGALLGMVVRVEAERLLEGEEPERIWQECEGCPGRWASLTRSDSADSSRSEGTPPPADGR